MPSRCYQCFRPASLCVCALVPSIPNRTPVLILQHVGERFHPFNTARMVNQSLQHCELIWDHNRGFACRQLPIAPSAALLYPDADSTTPCLEEASQRPSQLIVVDGTWHQARTIVRDTPQLHALPRFRIRNRYPGEYQIRREPSSHCLSTLEATVAALRVLEPETRHVDALRMAFRTMIQRQVQRSSGRTDWRRRRTRPKRQRHVPRVILEHPQRLVVAYGESTPTIAGEGPPRPFTWIAQRFATGERFTAFLHEQLPCAASILHHTGLTPSNFENGTTNETFRQKWKSFLRPHDVLFVYHARTARLLANLGAECPRSIALKGLSRQHEMALNHGSTPEWAPHNGSSPADDTPRGTHRLNVALSILSTLRSFCDEDLNELA